MASMYMKLLIFLAFVVASSICADNATTAAPAAASTAAPAGGTTTARPTDPNSLSALGTSFGNLLALPFTFLNQACKLGTSTVHQFFGSIFSGKGSK